MSKYKHILLALELDSKNDNILINKAKEMVKQYGAKLSLIHAVEHLSNYGAAYGVTAGIDLEEELLQEAKKMMGSFAKKNDVSDSKQHVLIGPAKHVIIDEAKECKADLIVVGSHGRHGVRLLLGSTANAILHSAQCDVLAVRVQE